MPPPASTPQPSEAAGLLYCNCAYAQIIDPAVKAAVLRRLEDSGRPFTSVPDLCERSARRDPALARLASGGAIKIAACYPRAVKWLFASAGAPLDPARTEVVNLREVPAPAAAERLLAGDLQPNLPPDQIPATPDGPGPHQASERTAPASAEAVPAAASPAASPAAAGRWQPWFPVIDYDRCTNCMQCLSFCLFGVYGVDARGEIEVQSHDSCKTSCPACSRVCPEAAIMFPKYKAGPINGAAVRAEDLQREKMKVDISALLGGDIYAALRRRNERPASRFSPERDSDQALQERRKCLAKLAQAGDIPPEVLMSLPGPEEILRRAGEARAKAQAALAARL